MGNADDAVGDEVNDEAAACGEVDGLSVGMSLSRRVMGSIQESSHEGRSSATKAKKVGAGGDVDLFPRSREALVLSRGR